MNNEKKEAHVLKNWATTLLQELKEQDQANVLEKDFNDKNLHQLLLEYPQRPSLRIRIKNQYKIMNLINEKMNTIQ